MSGPIVVDSSAIAAVFFEEPEAGAVARRMASAERLEIAAASFVEIGVVLARKHPPTARATLARLDAFLVEARISVAPLDEVQARVALQARVRFGRGFEHSAQLNYGDCFAYALAKVRGAPLLYVGDDFAHTDLQAALN